MFGGLSEVLSPVGARRARRGWWHETARLRALALAAGLGAALLFAAAAALGWAGFGAPAALLRAPLFPLALAAILFLVDGRLARIHRRHDRGPD